VKVVKIKTENKWNELTVGKVYQALPREDTLAPYVNPYVWFDSHISSKINDDKRYYLIEESDQGTTKYFYPISEFKTIEEIREENIENILSL
jgi:hypothetical protein